MFDSLEEFYSEERLKEVQYSSISTKPKRISFKPKKNDNFTKLLQNPKLISDVLQNKENDENKDKGLVKLTSPIKENKQEKSNIQMMPPPLLTSPMRPKNYGNGVLSPVNSNKLPITPKSKSRLKNIASSTLSSPLSMNELHQFQILGSDCSYSSDDFGSEDDRFPSWIKDITQSQLLQSTKQLYDQHFRPREISEITVESLLKRSSKKLRTKTTLRQNSSKLDIDSINNNINNNNITINNSENIQNNEIKLEASTARISDFEIGKPVGAGKFGTIYLARAHKNRDLIVAIKVMHRKRLSESHLVQLVREISHLNALRHENIISLFDFFYDARKVYIITEYANGGDLYHSLCAKRKFNENEAANIIKQAAFAIKVCHEKDIVHRDIKPENFVFGAGNKLKLIDFGWSAPCKKSENDRRTSLCGTLDYLAPEIVMGKSYHHPIDIWCLGVLLFELLSGSPPFEDQDVQITKLNIKYASLRYPSHFSTEVIDFLKCILIPNPNDRLSIDELISHSWINSF